MSFLSRIFLSLTLVVQGFFGHAQPVAVAPMSTTTVDTVVSKPKIIAPTTKTPTVVVPVSVPAVSVNNPVDTPAPVTPTAPKTFITPSGAVLDQNGNVISTPAPTQSPAVQAAYDQNLAYQNQLQVVQNKIKPLQDQFNQYMNGCSNVAVEGSAAVACQAGAGIAGALAEYENAIQGDLLTPVTSTSITYENKLDDLSQQIFQIKKNYYQQVENVQGMITYEEAKQAKIQQLMDTANTQIQALNLQKQTLLLEYQSGLSN